jgi:hypothetical protein
MTVEVTLPRLVGTRKSADEILGDILDGKAGDVLEVHARAVLNAAPSFIDEFVKLAVKNSLAEIRLIGESNDLRHMFQAAASRRGSIKITAGIFA